MKSLSNVQTTLTRLRKKYRKAIENRDAESTARLKPAIHALEWVLEMQNTPTSVDTD